MRNIAERALKTFIEATIGALVVTLPGADLADKAVIKSLIIGAIATGGSALLNYILNTIEANKGDDENV